MSDSMLWKQSLQHGKHGKGTHTYTYQCDPAKLAKLMEGLDEYLRAHTSGPHEGMALLHATLRFYQEKLGVLAITTGENSPQ